MAGAMPKCQSRACRGMPAAASYCAASKGAAHVKAEWRAENAAAEKTLRRKRAQLAQASLPRHPIGKRAAPHSLPGYQRPQQAASLRGERRTFAPRAGRCRRYGPVHGAWALCPAPRPALFAPRTTRSSGICTPPAHNAQGPGTWPTSTAVPLSSDTPRQELGSRAQRPSSRIRIGLEVRVDGLPQQLLAGKAVAAPHRPPVGI